MKNILHHAVVYEVLIKQIDKTRSADICLNNGGIHAWLWRLRKSLKSSRSFTWWYSVSDLASFHFLSKVEFLSVYHKATHTTHVAIFVIDSCTDNQWTAKIKSAETLVHGFVLGDGCLLIYYQRSLENKDIYTDYMESNCLLIPHKMNGFTT